MATCALTHGAQLDHAPFVTVIVLHGPWRVVHGTCEHADEGNGDSVVGRGTRVVDFVPLKTFHALYVDIVGISALKTVGMVSAMKVDQQVVAGRGLKRALLKVDQLLVVTVKEVDLQTCNAPFFKLCHGLVHLLVEGVPYAPQDKTYTVITGIASQLGHVDSRRYLSQIEGVAPSLVKVDIFDTVLGCEIDVVFIGVCVEACMEVHSRKI